MHHYVLARMCSSSSSIFSATYCTFFCASASFFLSVECLWTISVKIDGVVVPCASVACVWIFIEMLIHDGERKRIRSTLGTLLTLYIHRESILSCSEETLIICTTSIRMFFRVGKHLLSKKSL